MQQIQKSTHEKRKRAIDQQTELRQTKDCFRSNCPLIIGHKNVQTRTKAILYAPTMCMYGEHTHSHSYAIYSYASHTLQLKFISAFGFFGIATAAQSKYTRNTHSTIYRLSERDQERKKKQQT